MNSISNEKIAVIDVETTGLSPWRNDRIIEIAIVTITPTGNILSEYETLINPNRDLGPSRIHQIAAADVLLAPAFEDVAGDVLDVISKSNIIAGHNISFDKNFLMKEYERIGVTFPDIPLFCTCHLLGRNSLSSCCSLYGITTDDPLHHALTDARLTAQLVATLCADNSNILAEYRIASSIWPQLRPNATKCFSRQQSQQALIGPPKFLTRLVNKMSHDVDASEPNVLAYLALLDRILEDRIIDADEENTLVDAILQWKLTKAQIDDAHRNYLNNLVVLALEDGVISNAERHDLHLVARLLGQDESTLDNILETTAKLLANTKSKSKARKPSDLIGKTVCFTGELQSTIQGQMITREFAEKLARDAGLNVLNTVNKKLDILVVADPNTQSGKAKKARAYGIRILSDNVFWRMINITVD